MTPEQATNYVVLKDFYYQPSGMTPTQKKLKAEAKQAFKFATYAERKQLGLIRKFITTK